ncbi:ParB/RepB/Spo0J family partition protein [Pseudomonas asiatica]|uniref:ParB/RepB/Spo0J family partition protein n=1 Tax=Pseudomonas asiatica TaxID=2219225 RepID=UPI0010C07B45|nr:ParB/RepB/Spo0J family partition protein [Pseudomonas asiatica]EKT4529914.1 ParB/RepB/Spo0J family partition protein [Pseudomonas putida]
MRDLSRFRNLADVHTMSQDVQVGTVLMLDPTKVRVEKQVRRKFKNIEEMAESMKDDGQHQPIVVSPLDSTTGTYLLQKGERRLRAALLIGGDFKIAAIVDATVRTKSKATSSQLSENIHRENLTPIEIAAGLVELREQLKEEGKKGTGRDLAEACKKPESWVSKHLALATLPDELAALIEDDVTSDSEVIHTLSKICELKPSLYLQLVEQARSEAGLSRQEVREQLKIARGGSQPPSPQTPPAQPAAGGNVMPINPANQQPGGSPDQKRADEAGQGSRNPPSTGLQQDAADPNLNGGSGSDSEKISHAETFNGTGNQEIPAVNGQNSGKPNPPESRKKLGKGEVREIPHNQIVIQVRVSTAKRRFTGELLTNYICGEGSKGMVSYLEGSKQVKGLFDLDSIEILTMAQLAQIEDEDE